MWRKHVEAQQKKEGQKLTSTTSRGVFDGPIPLTTSLLEETSVTASSSSGLGSGFYSGSPTSNNASFALKDAHTPEARAKALLSQLRGYHEDMTRLAEETLTANRSFKSSPKGTLTSPAKSPGLAGQTNWGKKEHSASDEDDDSEGSSSGANDGVEDRKKVDVKAMLSIHERRPPPKVVADIFKGGYPRTESAGNRQEIVERIQSKYYPALHAQDLARKKLEEEHAQAAKEAELHGGATRKLKNTSRFNQHASPYESHYPDIIKILREPNARSPTTTPMQSPLMGNAPGATKDGVTTAGTPAPVPPSGVLARESGQHPQQASASSSTEGASSLVKTDGTQPSAVGSSHPSPTKGLPLLPEEYFANPTVLPQDEELMVSLAFCKRREDSLRAQLEIAFRATLATAEAKTKDTWYAKGFTAGVEKVAGEKAQLEMELVRQKDKTKRKHHHAMLKHMEAFKQSERVQRIRDMKQGLESLIEKFGDLDLEQLLADNAFYLEEREYLYRRAFQSAHNFAQPLGEDDEPPKAPRKRSKGKKDSDGGNTPATTMATRSTEIYAQLRQRERENLNLTKRLVWAEDQLEARAFQSQGLERALMEMHDRGEQADNVAPVKAAGTGGAAALRNAVQKRHQTELEAKDEIIRRLEEEKKELEDALRTSNKSFLENRTSMAPKATGSSNNSPKAFNRKGSIRVIRSQTGEAQTAIETRRLVTELCSRPAGALLEPLRKQCPELFPKATAREASSKVARPGPLKRTNSVAGGLAPRMSLDASALAERERGMPTFHPVASCFAACEDLWKRVLRILPSVTGAQGAIEPEAVEPALSSNPMWAPLSATISDLDEQLSSLATVVGRVVAGSLHNGKSGAASPSSPTSWKERDLSDSGEGESSDSASLESPTRAALLPKIAGRRGTNNVGRSPSIATPQVLFPFQASAGTTSPIITASRDQLHSPPDGITLGDRGDNSSPLGGTRILRRDRQVRLPALNPSDGGVVAEKPQAAGTADVPTASSPKAIPETALKAGVIKRPPVVSVFVGTVPEGVDVQQWLITKPESRCPVCDHLVDKSLETDSDREPPVEAQKSPRSRVSSPRTRRTRKKRFTREMVEEMNKQHQAQLQSTQEKMGAEVTRHQETIGALQQQLKEANAALELSSDRKELLSLLRRYQAVVATATTIISLVGDAVLSTHHELFRFSATVRMLMKIPEGVMRQIDQRCSKLRSGTGKSVLQETMMKAIGASRSKGGVQEPSTGAGGGVKAELSAELVSMGMSTAVKSEHLLGLLKSDGLYLLQLCDALVKQGKPSAVPASVPPVAIATVAGSATSGSPTTALKPSKGAPQTPSSKTPPPENPLAQAKKQAANSADENEKSAQSPREESKSPVSGSPRLGQSSPPPQQGSSKQVTPRLQHGVEPAKQKSPVSNASPKVLASAQRQSPIPEPTLTSSAAYASILAEIEAYRTETEISQEDEDEAEDEAGDWGLRDELEAALSATGVFFSADDPNVKAPAEILLGIHLLNSVSGWKGDKELCKRWLSAYWRSIRKATRQVQSNSHPTKDRETMDAVMVEGQCYADAQVLAFTSTASTYSFVQSFFSSLQSISSDNGFGQLADLPVARIYVAAADNQSESREVSRRKLLQELKWLSGVSFSVDTVNPWSDASSAPDRQVVVLASDSYSKIAVSDAGSVAEEMRLSPLELLSPSGSQSEKKKVWFMAINTDEAQDSVPARTARIAPSPSEFQRKLQGEEMNDDCTKSKVPERKKEKASTVETTPPPLAQNRNKGAAEVYRIVREKLAAAVAASTTSGGIVRPATAEFVLCTVSFARPMNLPNKSWRYSVGIFRDCCLKTMDSFGGLLVEAPPESAHSPSWLVAFMDPRDGLGFALELQRQTLNLSWDGPTLNVTTVFSDGDDAEQRAAEQKKSRRPVLLYRGIAPKIGLHLCEAIPRVEESVSRVQFGGRESTVSSSLAHAAKAGEVLVSTGLLAALGKGPSTQQSSAGAAATAQMQEWSSALGRPFLQSLPFPILVPRVGPFDALVCFPKELQGRLQSRAEFSIASQSEFYKTLLGSKQAIVQEVSPPLTVSGSAPRKGPAGTAGGLQIDIAQRAGDPDDGEESEDEAGDGQPMVGFVYQVSDSGQPSPRSVLLSLGTSSQCDNCGELYKPGLCAACQSVTCRVCKEEFKAPMVGVCPRCLHTPTASLSTTASGGLPTMRSPLTPGLQSAKSAQSPLTRPFSTAGLGAPPTPTVSSPLDNRIQPPLTPTATPIQLSPLPGRDRAPFVLTAGTNSSSEPPSLSPSTITLKPRSTAQKASK